MQFFFGFPLFKYALQVLDDIFLIRNILIIFEN